MSTEMFRDGQIRITRYAPERWVCDLHGEMRGPLCDHARNAVNATRADTVFLTPEEYRLAQEAA